MKVVIRLALLCLIALTQCAWADSGPYYVSYKGYCEVKKVYITPRNDVYGSEISCGAYLGQVLVGSIAADGKATVATGETLSAACLSTFYTNGTVGIACSKGANVSYGDPSPFTVRQSVSEKASEPVTHVFNVSTEMPDIEKTRNLPSLQQ